MRPAELFFNEKVLIKFRQEAKIQIWINY